MKKYFCFNHFILLVMILCSFSCNQAFAQWDSTQINSLIDLRAQHSDSRESWLNGGMSKMRFDHRDNALQLGQAAVDIRTELTNTWTLRGVINAYTDRDSVVDVTELYAQWKPLPINGYKIKIKVGAFFPAISFENSATGWTNPWMISSSAINTWIGEELRTNGLEFSIGHSIPSTQFKQDIELVTSIYQANDAAGALLVWRGWSIGDRVTGLAESIPLPRMPSIFAPTGIYDDQSDHELAFKEIDHHWGYYAGINYTVDDRYKLRVLHYDNRGNPLAYENHQWAWQTHLNSVGFRAELTDQDIFVAQQMSGNILWGNKFYGVYADVSAWYLLFSHSINAHRFSLRYDHFSITNRDAMWTDNNAEQGHGLAIAWEYKIDPHKMLGVEYLNVDSKRPERTLVVPSHYNSDAQLPAAEMETSVQFFYRLLF